MTFELSYDTFEGEPRLHIIESEDIDDVLAYLKTTSFSKLKIINRSKPPTKGKDASWIVEYDQKIKSKDIMDGDPFCIYK